MAQPAPNSNAKLVGRCFLRFHGDRQRAFSPLHNRSNVYYSRTDPSVAIADLAMGDADALSDQGVEIVPGRQYRPLMEYSADEIYQPMEFHPKSLADVIVAVRADSAWKHATGSGVHIAVIDTGICGKMPEFPQTKRSPLEWPGGNNWTDISGHGSMVACIAAGTKQAGGRFNGIAPGSQIIACKTSFHDTQLYQIYDHLLGLVEKNTIGRLVVNNSFGLYSAAPPEFLPSNPLVTIIRDAVARGVVVVFAAGNNHVKVCGHSPSACGPNSIWGINSLEEVISVGTVDEDNRMDRPPLDPNGFSHRDSSRGPGQMATSVGKPDCVAPTYGEVMWGCGYDSMQWWGTSGAAPQVAGLAALLLERNSSLTPAQVLSIIRATATPLPLEAACAGAGLINCELAVTSA